MRGLVLSTLEGPAAPVVGHDAPIGVPHGRPASSSRTIRDDDIRRYGPKMRRPTLLDAAIPVRVAAVAGAHAFVAGVGPLEWLFETVVLTTLVLALRVAVPRLS